MTKVWLLYAGDELKGVYMYEREAVTGYVMLKSCDETAVLYVTYMRNIRYEYSGDLTRVELEG
jgi:myo-inositol-hexaphosphate 3-phosphohydrolase